MLVGDVELAPVFDAVGLLAEYADAYPRVPEEAWEPYRALYPELFAGAPGHYPGQMALRLDSAGAAAILIADVAVHPALLEEPDWLYVSDGHPGRCAETRRALLPELVDRDVVVACGHYPGSGIGRVVTRDGRVAWEEVR